MARIAAAPALLLFASTAIGQPYLVRDIDTGPSPWAGSNPTDFTRAGDVVFFVATIGQRRQLWRTDGTEAGTALVKDGVRPEHLTAVGDLLFFVGWEEDTGSELWRSDGTEAGTVLVRDIRPGPDPPNTFRPPIPTRLSAVDDLLYFAADDGVHGYELWRSDGTHAGTRMVADILPGSGGSLASEGNLFVGLDAIVYFPAHSGGGDFEPWRSDGTAEGTWRLRDVRPGPRGSLSLSARFGVAAGRIWFAADDGEHGSELWVSDGTEDGTMMVKDINPGPASSLGRVPEFLRGALYFTANDGVHGLEVWTTDGTAEGTEMVADLEPGRLSSSPADLVVAGDVLYLTIAPAPHDRPRRLWKLEDGVGTPLQSFGETLVVVPLPDQLILWGPAHPCGPSCDCESESVPWSSRGTPESTVPLDRPVPGFSPQLGSFAVLDGQVLFAADDGVHGSELWRTDGTASGTVMVKDIHAAPGSSEPRWLTAFDDRVFFVAASPPDRDHLWVSDGTRDGTVPLLWFDEPDSHSSPGNLTVTDDLLFFTTATESERHLWRTAGTPETTFEIARFSDGANWSIEAARGGIYFVGWTAATGGELWFSDGSVHGTRLVKDISPGPAGSGIGLGPSMGRILFFTAHDGVHGRQLWCSDGTEAGTYRITQIGDLVDQGSKWPIAVVEPLAFFFPPYSAATRTWTVWRTDGTERGTIQLREGVSANGPRAQVSGRLVFTSRGPRDSNLVWSSDGSQVGTRIIANFEPIHGTVGGWRLFPGAGGAFFQARGEAGRAVLWHTDGTSPGTRAVAEIGVGEFAEFWLEVEGRTHFVTRLMDGTRKTGGFRLWRTDGTADGTLPLEALPLPVEVESYLAIAGSRILFTGSEESTGVELWALDLAESPPCAADCNGGGIAGRADLRQAVRVALLEEARASCPSADRNRDGRVTVDEIVAAAGQRLAGDCPG